MHDLAKKVFWSSILPSTSRFDVQYVSDDLRYFQFDRCELHARGHVQHEYKLTYAFANRTWLLLDGSACDVVSGTAWVQYWWPCRLPEVSACWQTSMEFNCPGMPEVFSACWRVTFSVRKPCMALPNLLTAVFVGWASIVIFFLMYGVFEFYLLVMLEVAFFN